MASKKNLKEWFLQNIILPNNEILDKPGYVVSQYAGSKIPCYVRELFIPEHVLASIESRIVKKYGKKSRRPLYSAGKGWGLRFAHTTNIPKKSSMTDQEFTQFLGQFLKYLESEYSKKLTYSYDPVTKILTTTYEDLLIERLSAQGWLLLGAITGAWQHILGTSCQGTLARTSKNVCIIRTGPSKLIGSAVAYAPKKDIVSLLEPEYFVLNAIQPPSFVKTSFWSLLEAGVVSYEGGFFSLGSERLVLNEASFIYFLEAAVRELPTGPKILFEVAFDFASNKKSNLTSETLGAFGFGDVYIDSENRRALCKSYPWTSFSKKTDFPIMRGFLSGLLSRNAGKRIILKKTKKSISGNTLDLEFDQ